MSLPHNADHPSSHATGEVRALPEHASPASTGLPTDASQHPANRAYPNAPAPKKSSWVRVVIIALVVLGFIGFVVYRIKSNHKADAQQARGAQAMASRPVPIAFDVVQQRPVPIYLNALGTVTAYNTVTLKSRVDGQITRVNFREGQHVSQGQLLIEIDPHPYQATLAQAEGNLVRDEANAANAQAQAQRYNQLYAAGVVSKEQAQTQESTAGQANGTLAADRAAIQSARVNLNYTKISSPISGIVGLRQVDIGNIVAANSSTGLVVITQVEPIAVIFTLPEDQLPQVFERLRGGHKLVAEAWDRANLQKLATGALLTVDNQIDTTTGTAKLKAVFDNHDGALYPNQFVNIRLVLENRQNAITIPSAALQTGTDGSYVYVVDMQHPNAAAQAGADAGGRGKGKSSGHAGTAGGETNAPPAGDATASAGAPSGTGSASGGHGANGGGGRSQTSYPVHKRVVTVDLTQGTTVVIHSGLKPGERVVTDGEEKLQDGSNVIPRPSQQVESRAPGNASVAGKEMKAVDAGRSNSQPGNPNGYNGGTGDPSSPLNQPNQQGTPAGAPRQ